MTLIEAKQIYLGEFGLLERYSWSEEFQELHLLDRLKIEARLEELEPLVQLVCAIDVRGGGAKSVTMFDPETHELLKVFNSAGDAAIYIGSTEGNIHFAAKHERPTAGGYIWRREDSTTPADFKRPVRKMRAKARPVEKLKRVMIRGRIVFAKVEEFSSIAEAAKALYPDSYDSAKSHIAECCVSPDLSKSYKGYTWCYKEILKD